MTDMLEKPEPGIPQLKGSRTFKAPVDLVYRAWTDPDLLVQWLGPRRLTMKVDEYDVRHGGSWRYVHIDEDGTEYGFRGVFHGEPSPDGVVQTFEFEGAPGHVQLDTAVFEANGNETVVHMNTVFQSVEDRDAMLRSGMESGWTESMERLDEVLEKLSA
jgi:uncharacterized protein YndB with AHSA1/START domain